MCPKLKNELRVSTPFSSVEEEVSLNILRTAAMLEHSVAERLKPYGLTPTQYNVLRILRGAGTEGLCRTEVTERMLTPVPDATRLLDRLEEAGLVARVRNSDDRRFVTARITSTGLDRLAEMDAPVERMHHELLGHVDDTDLRSLADLLESAREGL